MGTLRRWTSLGAFWAWAVTLLVAGSSLGAAHYYVLPKPEPGSAALERSLASLRSSSEQDGWLALHVLYAQCRCSRNVLEHLAHSIRPPGYREKVLLVGERAELDATLTRIAARGMDVRRTTAAELRSKYQIEAAPLLLIVDRAGRVRYSGGYSERKQGPELQDTLIMTKLARRERVEELPLFGCAVSRELQNLLDPLGLKSVTTR